MDKELLEAMAQLLQPITNDLAGIKSEMAEIKGDLSGIKSEMSGLQDDLSGIKSEIAQTKQDARHTRVVMEAQEEKFQLLCEAQAETAAKFGQLDRMEGTLNKVKSEVQVIRDVVRFHSSDIAILKKAAL